MNKLLESMLQHADPTQVEGLMRFFKTGPGQYGYGDLFLGIKVPVTRTVVKECWKDVGFTELEECVTSKYHEVRLAALLTLVEIFGHNKKNTDLQKQCVDFYLSHTDYINNYWLLDKDRSLLYDLARSGKTIWEQRIGMVSTMQFIRHGQTADTYAIAEILLNHKHDLIQKAVGWLLREAGKRNPDELRQWLTPRAHTMPRTALRYAIEKIPDTERRAWLEK